MYIFGPPGTGKSTCVTNVLKACAALYPQLDYYSKMGGMSKFWDGYDNQPLVVIDDPGLFNIKFNEDELNAFKNVISSTRHTVEVKGSSMQFDSFLVIIISNYSPNIMALSAGPASDAVYDRLAGSRSVVSGGVNCLNKTAARRDLGPLLCTFLVKIGRVFNVCVDVDAVLARAQYKPDWDQ